MACVGRKGCRGGSSVHSSNSGDCHRRHALRPAGEMGASRTGERILIDGGAVTFLVLAAGSLFAYAEDSRPVAIPLHREPRGLLLQVPVQRTSETELGCCSDDLPARSLLGGRPSAGSTQQVAWASAPKRELGTSHSLCSGCYPRHSAGDNSARAPMGVRAERAEHDPDLAVATRSVRRLLSAD